MYYLFAWVMHIFLFQSSIFELVVLKSVLLVWGEVFTSFNMSLDNILTQVPFDSDIYDR